MISCCSAVLRGSTVGVSNRAIEGADVNRRLVGWLSRGEYSTGLFSVTNVDLVAVEAKQFPTQRKHDGALCLGFNDNPLGTSFEAVDVLGGSRHGKYAVPEVRHVRKVSQQH